MEYRKDNRDNDGGYYRVRKRAVARAGVSFCCRNLVYCNTGHKGKGERREKGSRLAGKLSNCIFTAFSLCLPSSPLNVVPVCKGKKNSVPGRGQEEWKIQGVEEHKGGGERNAALGGGHR